MKWSKDTNKLKHAERYLVYYDGTYPIHSIQTYIKYDDDEDVNFTGEGFYTMDIDTDTWKRCYRQPKYFRELDMPEIFNVN